MPTRTVDLLLNLESGKAPNVEKLKSELDKLEKEAEQAKKAIDGLLLIDGKGSASVNRAKQNLAKIEQKIAGIDAQARKMTLAKRLKEAGDQANRTREKMEKLAQVGSRLMMAGGAILAPMVLFGKKYLDDVKKQEEDRIQIAKDAIKKLEDLEEDRKDTVKKYAEKIKDIDKEIADNRLKLADISRGAEDKSREVSENLKRTLRDFGNDRKKLELEFKRGLEDIAAGGGTSEEKAKEAQRLKEDYAIAMAEIAQKEEDAKEDAAREERKIAEERAREMKKLAIENEKLAEQKRANLAEEQRELKKIADEERKAMAEKAAAEAARSKTVAGILEMSKEWEKIQARIGKLIVEQILPLVDRALPYLEKAISFLEANPQLISAALMIGTGLLAAGGIMGTIAQVVGTLATIQGLLAGAGVAGGAGITTAGITSAITAALPAVGAALLAVLTSPLTWAVAALALTVPIMNWLLGTNQTWKDIGETGKKALILIGYGIDKLLKGIGAFFSNLGRSIGDGFRSFGSWVSGGFEKLGRWIADAISRLVSFLPHRATGGYMPTGLYNVSEGGKREFALSHSTTRAAESIIGGQLSQAKLINALNGSRRISYNDHRRIDSSLSNRDRQIIRDDTMAALAGAL